MVSDFPGRRILIGDLRVWEGRSGPSTFWREVEVRWDDGWGGLVDARREDGWGGLVDARREDGWGLELVDARWEDGWGGEGGGSRGREVGGKNCRSSKDGGTGWVSKDNNEDESKSGCCCCGGGGGGRAGAATVTGDDADLIASLSLTSSSSLSSI